MSYSDWLGSISNIIPSIINWLVSLSESLLSNYIIVTILGFILFYTLFSIVIYIIDSIKQHKNKDFDNIK